MIEADWAVPAQCDGAVPLMMSPIYFFLISPPDAWLKFPQILAKQAEIREELQGVDSLNSVCISDIELKCMNKLELFQNREQAERDALKKVVDTKLNQVLGQIARTENLRQDGLTALYEKVEEFQTKQLDGVKQIRGEVHENIRDVQVQVLENFPERP